MKLKMQSLGKKKYTHVVEQDLVQTSYIIIIQALIEFTADNSKRSCTIQRSQSLTSLMTDLCQDIKQSSFI